MTQVFNEKMQDTIPTIPSISSITSIPSDIQIKFTLRPRKDLEKVNNENNDNNDELVKDQERDQRITEFYTRLYKIPLESHVQGCTKEHVLLDKDKLDEIIDSVISLEIKKKIQEKILLHSTLYELIIPVFKCHGLGFYYKPKSDREIFIKNLQACYHENCPMYAKKMDSSDKINYEERWNDATDEEREIFSQISLCAEKVFGFMYPNYKEIAKDMEQKNLDFNISIERIPKMKIFNNDEKDKSICLDRREMNLRSIQRCSKLLDNLTDGSGKEKGETRNRDLNLTVVERQLQQILLRDQLTLIQPEPWNRFGKRFVVTSVLSLLLVIFTSLGYFFLNN